MYLTTLHTHTHTHTHTVRGAVGTLDTTDNYSGHFVDSYSEKRRFIVAEGPQESSAAKFWQVVWDEDCNFVVMLTPQDSSKVGGACLYA